MDTIKKFVNEHTEEHCGLNVAQVQVFKEFDLIKIVITKKRKTSKKHKRSFYTKKTSQGNKDIMKEWECQAKDLIKKIGADPGAGYGGLGLKFKLQWLSHSGFHLLENKENIMNKNTIKIKFEGIDTWNRPIFKDIHSTARYGSTDIRFNYSATERKVCTSLIATDLCYFGNSFNCKPLGLPVDNLEII